MKSPNQTHAPRNISAIASAILMITAAAIPTKSSASVISTVTLIAQGLSIASSMATNSASLYSLFGSDGDDNPLYRTSSTSPTLSISATLTTFDLLLQQPLDIGEFEDDYSAQIKGITKVTDAFGSRDAWEWSLTLEADLDVFTTNLDAIGFVKHVYNPHPSQGESDAPAMPFNLKLAKSCTGVVLCTWTQGAASTSSSTKTVHQSGTHEDTLASDLSWNCCSTAFANIDDFTVKLKAAHVPLPPALPVFALTLLGGGLWFRKRRSHL